MTDREKAIIMAYTGCTTLAQDKLQIFYDYVAELIGRPVFTHELPQLADAIKGAAYIDFVKICTEEQMPMTLNEYQQLAQRTSSNDPGVFGTIAAKKIDNGILGMAGEGGECADIWKKYLHQGHPLDREKLIKEAGDVLWYVAELAAGLGVTLEEIATRNIEKLRNRYPEGFAAERSINRAGADD
jgi:NTP pyrophosphatase (non-canonical NTP hydrolase)